VLHVVAAGWAAMGGLALIAIACLTTGNVLLKTVFGTYIPGEFEIADLGVVMLVFTFMPLAQLRRGYVIVDLFTYRAPATVKARLDAAADVVFALCMALIAWRMFEGGLDIAATGERTPELHLRYWWAFAIGVPSLALLVVACLHTAWIELRRSGK
jgi:TRAP-type C4-dicarboxylate transport system permease small subunit